MRSTGILTSAVLVALAALATLYLTIGRNPVATNVVQPERTRISEATRPAQAVALDAAQRVPATAEPPEPAGSAAPTPSAPAPTVREFVGDPNSWPAEYANKPLAELIADAERLSEEFKKDIDAEVEKRFQDGRYVSYARGAQPWQGTTNGITVGRGDENTIKYVDLDPRVEPELFLKQAKEMWLRGEITNRQR